MEGAAAVARVKSIYVYPIKSCRGISVPQAPLTPTGITFYVILIKFKLLTHSFEPGDTAKPRDTFRLCL